MNGAWDTQNSYLAILSWKIVYFSRMKLQDTIEFD